MYTKQYEWSDKQSMTVLNTKWYNVVMPVLQIYGKAKQLRFAGVSFIHAVKVMAPACAVYSISCLMHACYWRPLQRRLFIPSIFLRLKTCGWDTAYIQFITLWTKLGAIVLFPFLLHSISLMFWWGPEHGWGGEAWGNSPAANVLSRASACFKFPPFLLDFMVPSGQVCSP